MSYIIILPQEYEILDTDWCSSPTIPSLDRLGVRDVNASDMFSIPGCHCCLSCLAYQSHRRRMFSPEIGDPALIGNDSI